MVTPPSRPLFVVGGPGSEVERCMICYDPVENDRRPFRSTTDEGDPIAICRGCVAEALGEIFGEDWYV